MCAELLSSKIDLSEISRHTKVNALKALKVNAFWIPETYARKIVSTKLKFGIIKVHKFGIINISISSKQESRPEYQK